MTVWSLTNPLDASPVLKAVDVAVVEYMDLDPPAASQLGGDPTKPIDVGDSRIRNVVFRDGSIWAAHTIAGGANSQFARARYVRLAVSGPTVLEALA